MATLEVNSISLSSMSIFYSIRSKKTTNNMCLFLMVRDIARIFKRVSINKNKHIQNECFNRVFVYYNIRGQ